MSCLRPSSSVAVLWVCTALILAALFANHAEAFTTGLAKRLVTDISKPPQYQLQCTGNANDRGSPSVTWDKANTSISDFCQNRVVKSTQCHTYLWELGSTAVLMLSIENPWSKQNLTDVPHCLNMFSAALNNCYGNDPNNPQNLKYGSQMITDDGWDLAILPGDTLSWYTKHEMRDCW